MGGGKGGGGGFPGESDGLADPIFEYKGRTGVYPSNAQTWWAFKRPIQVGSNESPRYYLEVFDPGMRHQVTVGNKRAPAGHYIYDAFNLDRSAATGIGGLPSETSYGARPTVVAFYEGRAWYAGVKSSGYASRVYYSQIIEDDNQVGNCYQENDPTNENTPDLLPTDGGVVVIPDIAEIHGMFVKGSFLFLLASNGVWSITGSVGSGFKPTDYTVAKVDDTPCLSPYSIVDVSGTPVWWNRSGIYTLAQAEGGIQVQSLTDKTIKTFFQAIPIESKKWAQGSYNMQTKEIQWVYASEAPATEAERFVYDRVLLFDTKTGGFSPWEIYNDSDIRLVGIIAVEGAATVVEQQNVVVGTDNVVSNGDNIVSFKTTTQEVDSHFKYMTLFEEAVGTMTETS